MRKSMIYVISAAGVVLILLAVLVWQFWRWAPPYSPVRHMQEVYFPALDERIYMSFEEWGVSYDRQLVIISTKPKTRSAYEAHEDYVFHTADSPVFYRVVEDTLILYVRHASPIPERFVSGVQVRQVLLGSHEELVEMERNHRGMGLTKVGGPLYRPPGSP